MVEVRKLKLDVPFNLLHTLESGQVFRWRRMNEWWVGVVEGEVIHAKQGKGFLFFKTEKSLEFLKSYFRLEDDLDEIFEGRDDLENIKNIIEEYYGLRIIRQNPKECLISYICATNNSIPNIKKMISNLSRRFGRKISEGFYSFPELETLASSKISDLRECKVGFRASYIKKASKRLCDMDLESLKSLSYRKAKSELLKLKGVGEKVSDCVLLFSLEKLEAFPVDVNIRNIIKNLYLKDSNSLKEIRDFGRRKFGRFCGYYNQYLYYHQLNLRKNCPPIKTLCGGEIV